LEAVVAVEVVEEEEEDFEVVDVEEEEEEAEVRYHCYFILDTILKALIVLIARTCPLCMVFSPR